MKAKHLLFCISFFLTTQLVKAQAPEIWGLTQSGGAFYGGTIFSMKADGSDFSTAFDFSNPNGWMPMGNLYKASDGNLYGACFEGGDYYSCTLFRYDPNSGEYIDVYDFDIIHGDYPTSGVVERNGILYGNASSGGYYGGGVIYSYNIATGVYTDLFNMTGATGSYPYSCPVIDGDGKLYGVTVYGGANMAGVLYSFDLVNNVYDAVFDFGGTNGSAPYGGLIQATNGKLYGMTSDGGANGHGTIYSFDPSGNSFEVIYDFDGTNGGSSRATLMQGSNGFLYGLTTGGGANNDGVIFSFDLSTDAYTKLFDFSGSDGSAPLGNLMQAGTFLCGTTSTGGNSGSGTAFNFNLESANYIKLVDFDMTNGSNPNGGFITLGDDIGTGVQEPVSGQLAVYPNPVTQYVICSLPSLENGKVDITITDVCGKEILAKQLPVNNSRLKIDLGNLSSGVYSLEVIAGTEKMVTKLLKN